jgi:hypothetical protein
MVHVYFRGRAAAIVARARGIGWIRRFLERVMGIEPTSSAWEAEVLPLNYTRKSGS